MKTYKLLHERYIIVTIVATIYQYSVNALIVVIINTQEIFSKASLFNWFRTRSAIWRNMKTTSFTCSMLTRRSLCYWIDSSPAWEIVKII